MNSDPFLSVPSGIQVTLFRQAQSLIKSSFGGKKPPDFTASVTLERHPATLGSAPGREAAHTLDKVAKCSVAQEKYKTLSGG
jgi:hypothetical protein